MDYTEDTRNGRLPDPSLAQEADYYSGVNSKRLVAWIFDGILIGVICAVLLFFTTLPAVFILPFFFFFVGFAYRTFTLSGGSATWGMRLVGMELRRADGTKFDLNTAFMHTLLYTVGFAVTPMHVISMIMMLVTERKQGLPDMILGTAPIRRSI